MPPKLLVLAGMKFSQWTVIEHVGRSKHGDRIYRCKCDCGSVRVVTARELVIGNSRSCGHGNRITSEDVKTHGQHATKIYGVWCSMKQRCLNPRNTAYPDYGGRGIGFCKKWTRFEPFYEWASSSGYREGLTLERKNNNGNYTPSNCTWIPKGKQSDNTRRCVKITFQGKTLNLKQWSKELSLPYSTLQSRLKHGWSFKRAIQEPAIPAHLRHLQRGKIS